MVPLTKRQFLTRKNHQTSHDSCLLRRAAVFQMTGFACRRRLLMAKADRRGELPVGHRPRSCQSTTLLGRLLPVTGRLRRRRPRSVVARGRRLPRQQARPCTRFPWPGPGDNFYGLLITLEASIGHALFPEDGTTADALLRTAAAAQPPYEPSCRKRRMRAGSQPMCPDRKTERPEIHLSPGHPRPRRA